MIKSITSRIGGGLGNQLFMYAAAFALSKSHNAKLLIDHKSSYFKKNFYNFYLNNFTISANYSKIFYDSNIKNLKRKFLILFNSILKKKIFFIEKRTFDKKTRFYNVNLNNYHNNVILEGHFESERYFLKYRNDLLKEFKLKYDCLKNNKYKALILKNFNKIVSICVRQNRFSEKKNSKKNKNLVSKSANFTQKNIDYINRSIVLIKKKIKNPIFLLWSNSFKGLDNVFLDKNVIFIKNNKNKVIKDFALLLLCKNFIVAPSTFHWWGAWLCENKNGIIIRPKNMNPSKNSDFWPKRWLSI